MKNEPKDNSRKSKRSKVNFVIVVGFPLGIAIGFAMDNIGAGIAFGIAIAAAINLWKKKSEQAAASDSDRPLD